jgi:multidrug transporter EmrE-like cation transporter
MPYDNGAAKMKYWIALALALTLNATANLMMKFGVRRYDEARAQLEPGLVPLTVCLLTNWVLVVGLMCFAVNVAFYTYSLSGLRISIAYPIMVSGGFAIIAIVARKYLGDELSYGQWAGIALILVGVFLVARGTNPQTGG